MENKIKKRFSAGAISVTIWNNEQKQNGKVISYPSVSLQRTYQDPQGNWQHTANLRVNDLPKATVVLQKAYEFLVTKAEIEQ
ncbi:MAG: hypothetical protein ACMXYC_04740 [Candidatus Woesearchaeota archaeon]